MQNRRDPSVLRSLALSFGEGLAFSVGMKLTQGGARKSAPVEQPDFAPVAARLEEIDKRIQKVERPREPLQFDQKVIHAIVSAIETRLQETAAQMERRLSGIEATIGATAEAAVAKRIEQESAAMRAQILEIHGEFAGNVARIVAEQVAARTAEIQPAIESQVASAIAPLQAELSELRNRMAETENTMAEFVAAISMMCRKAADRNEQEHIEPSTVETSAPVEPAIAASSAEPEMDLPLPAFAQVRKAPGIWRIPVASSFLFAFTAIGLLMRSL